MLGPCLQHARGISSSQQPRLCCYAVMPFPPSCWPRSWAPSLRVRSATYGASRLCSVRVSPGPDACHGPFLPAATLRGIWCPSLAGACAAVLQFSIGGSGASCQLAVHPGPSTVLISGSRSSVTAASANAQAKPTWRSIIADRTRGGGGKHTERSEAPSGQSDHSEHSSKSRQATALALTASLGSIWACAAMPLSRRLGLLLDPAKCPDACWQAVFLSALVIGPVLACLSFVTAAGVLSCFSGAAWRGFACAPALAAASAGVSGAWNAAAYSKQANAQRARVSSRTCRQ